MTSPPGGRGRKAQRPHAGIILIWTLDHSQVRQIAAGIESHLQQWPRQDEWRDLVVAF